eukprot:10734980-Alexandrium_andersonii.AAC.1
MISAGPPGSCPPKLPPVHFMHCTAEQARACIATGMPIPMKQRLFLHQRELCGAAAAVRAESVLREHGGSLESAEAAVHGAVGLARAHAAASVPASAKQMPAHLLEEFSAAAAQAAAASA